MDNDGRNEDAEGVTEAARRFGAGVSPDAPASMARFPPASLNDDFSWREMDLTAPLAES